ncbi:MAG: glutaredoxin family protein [Bacteroidota bacterium]
MQKPKLQLYGTDWCTKSSAIRNYLQSKWIVFDDYNVETDAEAAERIKKLYDGVLKFPTLIYGNDFLKNPKIPELNEFLKARDIAF